MRIRVGTIMAIAVLCLAATSSWADLAPFSQDFEGLLESEADQPEQTALANDGWLGFVNVFGPDWGFWYNYGPFPAPNGGFGGPAISAVVLGEGGPEQGDKQLVVFSDYNNGNHGDDSGAIIETNVFQEQWVIGAADVGSTWRFEFDAKRGNLEGASMAGAFFKTLDPNAGFILTNFILTDLTGIPDTWDRYSVSIFIDASLEGQILQFGFINWASNGEGSAIFYDNVNFGPGPLGVSLDIKPGSCPNPLNARSRGVVPAALLGTVEFDVADIDVDSLQLEGVAPVNSSYEDVAEPVPGDACDCGESSPDGFLDLTLKFKTQELIEAIGPSSGQVVLTLTGALLDGTPIEGQDCMLFVGGGTGRRPEAARDSRRSTPRTGGTSNQDLQAR